MCNTIAQILDVQNQQLLQYFFNIEALFKEHPLYVMYEEKLNCNVETDHLSPKNVFPVFSSDIIQNQTDTLQALESAEHTAFEQCRQELSRFLEAQFFPNIDKIMQAVDEYDCLLQVQHRKQQADFK